MPLMLCLCQKMPNCAKSKPITMFIGHMLYLRRNNFKIEISNQLLKKLDSLMTKKIRIIYDNQSYNFERRYKFKIPWAAIYSFGLFVPYNGRKILLTTITNKRDLYNKKKSVAVAHNKYQLLNSNDNNPLTYIEFL